jgi:hypothetical protein
MHNIESGYINLRGDYGQQMKPLLDEMRKITPAGNGNGNLPIGLQMSPQVAKRFEKLSFDLFVIRLRAMILSAYVRDARVIARMAQVATNVRRGRDYNEKDPDYFYFSAMLLTAAANGMLDNSADLNPMPSKDDCSVDSGLWVFEDLELKDIDGKKAAEAWNRVLATAKQYRIDTTQNGWFAQLDRIPSRPARRSARADLDVVMDGKRALDFAKTIESLRALNHVSLMIYDTHREDIRAARDMADINARLGSTWEAYVKAADEKTKQLDGIIRIIQEKIPSDSMIESKEIADRVKKFN